MSVRLRNTAFTIAASFLEIALVAACGPSCPEIKQALDEEEALAEDVARVNALVDKRRAAVAEAEQGSPDQFYMKRIKFSVTGYELAIEIQVRIVKLSSRFSDTGLLEEHAELIGVLRCEIDELLNARGHTLSDRKGKAIRERHEQLSALLRKDGAVSDRELKKYFEEGITAANGS